MKKSDVPQDSHNSTYGGGHKLLYAQDDNGEMVGVQSAGWEVECEATHTALHLIKQQCEAAWQRAQNGETAPLEYYMYYRRMDLPMLAQTSGFFQWQVKRHLNPKRFKKLNTKSLMRYAEALGLPIETLRTLPDQPLHDLPENKQTPSHVDDH